MNMDILQLSDIRQGTPGITPVEGANLYENCVVALHNSARERALVSTTCWATARTRFKSILSQLVLAASSMRRVIGHVALL